MGKITRRDRNRLRRLEQRQQSTGGCPKCAPLKTPEALQARKERAGPGGMKFFGNRCSACGGAVVTYLRYIRPAESMVERAPDSELLEASPPASEYSEPDLLQEEAERPTSEPSEDEEPAATALPYIDSREASRMNAEYAKWRFKNGLR